MKLTRLHLIAGILAVFCLALAGCDTGAPATNQNNSGAATGTGITKPGEPGAPATK